MDIGTVSKFARSLLLIVAIGSTHPCADAQNPLRPEREMPGSFDSKNRGHYQTVVPEASTNHHPVTTQPSRHSDQFKAITIPASSSPYSPVASPELSQVQVPATHDPQVHAANFESLPKSLPGRKPLFQNSRAASSQDTPVDKALARNLEQPWALPGAADGNIAGYLASTASSLILILGITMVVLLVIRKFSSQANTNPESAESKKEISISHTLKLEGKNVLRIVNWNDCSFLVASDPSGIRSVLPVAPSFDQQLVDAKEDELSDSIAQSLLARYEKSAGL